jgi:nitrous oxidase accessory protein NosD
MLWPGWIRPLTGATANRSGAVVFTLNATAEELVLRSVIGLACGVALNASSSGPHRSSGIAGFALLK